MNRHERRKLMAHVRADTATPAQLQIAVELGEKAFPWLAWRLVVGSLSWKRRRR